MWLPIVWAVERGGWEYPNFAHCCFLLVFPLLIPLCVYYLICNDGNITCQSIMLFSKDLWMRLLLIIFFVGWKVRKKVHLFIYLFFLFSAFRFNVGKIKIQWTWVWASSGSWWWTGKPGVLWSMGSQRVGLDWVTELNWKYNEEYCTLTVSVSWRYWEIIALYSSCKLKVDFQSLYW